MKLVANGRCDIFMGGQEMEKFFGMAIYWLGHSMGKLSDGLHPYATIGSIAPTAQNVKFNIEMFNSVIEGFPLTKSSAVAMIESISHILTQERLQNPTNPLTAEEQGTINYHMLSFQAVFYSEFSQSNIFYISQKRAYDMTVLINQGQNVLSKDTLDRLGSSKEEVIKDIRESNRSMAFDISTAVGFHLYRAVEAIIIRDYFPVLNVQPDEWENNKNLGNYIRLLEQRNVDVKITAMLKHIKDHYRNPISHPEEFWDYNKAENAFGHATSVINVMVQDIEERRNAAQQPSS